MAQTNQAVEQQIKHKHIKQPIHLKTEASRVAALARFQAVPAKSYECTVHLVWHMGKAAEEASSPSRYNSCACRSRAD